MTNAPEYLRAGDIARLTGVSLRTARRWIANQILVSGKVGGARLVAKSELLGRVVTGKTPKTKVREFYDGEYPFITPTDIGYNLRQCVAHVERNC
jgi:excisionase family DNA binding protein